MWARGILGLAWMVLPVLGLGACPGGEDDGTGATSNSGPSSASNEDGPEAPTCEQAGGQCSCAGTCAAGSVISSEGACLQPPDESGACSMECCMPTSASSTAGTASGSETTEGTADSAASTSAASSTGAG